MIRDSVHPRKAPCPCCGTLGRRKRIRVRLVRSNAFQQELWREVHYGEYVAKCQCCKSFHSHPNDIDLKAKYDHKVRRAVIDRILVDKLNTATIQEAMKRDFLLELSSGYLYDCLENAIREYDGAEFRAKVLSEFSGTLCVDEIHLGHRVVLLASDPISDNPIACALVSSNDTAHMRRFLQNLKNHGFSPETVISDRSALVPRTIEEVWPQAKHQLCVFHGISEINDHVLDAVREVRRAIKPKRIKKGRGRPSKRMRARVKKLKEQREQADTLFRRRHPSYLKNAHLCKALEVLKKDNMIKLLHYLDHPSSTRSKVRTNNHVERCNRALRYLEKVRYKWRRRKTIVRHRSFAVFARTTLAVWLGWNFRDVWPFRGSFAVACFGV